MTTERAGAKNAQREVPAEAPGEVRRYLIRLFGMIALGLLIMTGVATWAWFKYGSQFDDSVKRAPVPAANY